MKQAPYSKQLNPSSRNSMAILTGSQAWTRAKSPYWCVGRKLVLPFGEHPRSFKWPVNGRDCVIWGFGDAESREALLELSQTLLHAGAVAVHWSGQWALTIHPDGTSDARLIEGADLSKMPAPLFRLAA